MAANETNPFVDGFCNILFLILYYVRQINKQAQKSSV